MPRVASASRQAARLRAVHESPAQAYPSYSVHFSACGVGSSLVVLWQAHRPSTAIAAVAMATLHCLGDEGSGSGLIMAVWSVVKDGVG